MIVDAVVDDALSPDFPLSVELVVFVRREVASRPAQKAVRTLEAVGPGTREPREANRTPLF